MSNRRNGIHRVAAKMLKELKNKGYAVNLLSGFSFDKDLVIASATVLFEGHAGRLYTSTVTTAREDFTKWGVNEWSRFIEKSGVFYGEDTLKRVESLTISMTPGGFENYILEATDLDTAGFNRIILTYNPPFFSIIDFMLTTDEQKNISGVSSVILAAQMVTPERLHSVKSDEPVAILVRKIAKNIV